MFALDGLYARRGTIFGLLQGFNHALDRGKPGPGRKGFLSRFMLALQSRPAGDKPRTWLNILFPWRRALVSRRQPHRKAAADADFTGHL